MPCEILRILFYFIFTVFYFEAGFCLSSWVTLTLRPTSLQTSPPAARGRRGAEARRKKKIHPFPGQIASAAARPCPRLLAAAPAHSPRRAQNPVALLGSGACRDAAAAGSAGRQHAPGRAAWSPPSAGAARRWPERTGRRRRTGGGGRRGRGDAAGRPCPPWCPPPEAARGAGASASAARAQEAT